MTIKTVRSRVLPAASRSWPKTFLKPPLSQRPHSSTPASFQSLHALESRDPHLLDGTFHHVGDFNTWTDLKSQRLQSSGFTRWGISHKMASWRLSMMHSCWYSQRACS